MSVIAEFRVPSIDFELGHILSVKADTTIELERLVPIGEVTVPLFWVHDSTRESFLDTVRKHPAVHDASALNVFEDRTLFSLEWDSTQDRLIEAIQTSSGQLLSAIGSSDTWELELRFQSHEALSEFTTRCKNEDISLEVGRVYNPTNPDVGPWFGLTKPQREAMRLAVGLGYYDIPRGCTTKELADELGISDQAVTERLRRAIVALVSNTLGAAESPE